MGAERKIAILGLGTLAALGVKGVVKNSGEFGVETFGDFSDLQPLAEKMDAFIVGADQFVANLDFFMPRRQKTVVITGDRTPATDQKFPIMLSPRSDETEINDVIGKLCASLTETEEHPGDLSAREKDVLRLIAAGKINKEIADELCISVNTVITHRKNISLKLGIKSASGLSLYAMMNGLI